jgi:hypothetical protein
LLTWPTPPDFWNAIDYSWLGVYQASQTADKKDEFRKYLERTKVIHVLTKSLTDLFEMDDRPDDPIAYLMTKLADQKNTSNTNRDRSAQASKPGGFAEGAPSVAHINGATRGDSENKRDTE